MKGKYFNLSNLTGGQLVETVYFVNKYQLHLKVFGVSQKLFSLQCEIVLQVAKKNLMLQLLQGFL